MSPQQVASLRVAQAKLPAPRGPVSERLIDVIRAKSGSALTRVEVPDDLDPWGEDAQLSLTLCQELHYRGWSDAGRDCEWDPVVIDVRIRIEDLFLAAIKGQISPPLSEAGTADAELGELARMVPTGASDQLARHGTEDEFRDYFTARSIYHLKEADPHAWAIPRLRGASKAAFVAVEFDEYGAGRADRVHQELFGDLLLSMQLDDSYLGYLDVAPAEVLAPVNLMSCFGLRRSLRGATIGHFAATEMTSPLGSARLVAGLERIGAPEEARHFYREHVEADAVHEQVMRDQVVAPLVADEPWLEADVLFGIGALQVVEERLDAAFLDAWGAGRSVMGPQR
ncbi:iron-containing redox enzyme family protein [Gordonia sp. (in: high G+C Gram-positive bacteria)]|uniref:iron-containing redox enzyme family protein n=1 Tax=Gordonia sp. (in: high G+C Gram-positive bacteria) TaxID=84139 RepID=UPI003C724DD5